MGATSAFDVGSDPAWTRTAAETLADLHVDSIGLKINRV